MSVFSLDRFVYFCIIRSLYGILYMRIMFFDGFESGGVKWGGVVRLVDFTFVRYEWRVSVGCRRVRFGTIGNRG